VGGSVAASRYGWRTFKRFYHRSARGPYPNQSPPPSDITSTLLPGSLHDEHSELVISILTAIIVLLFIVLIVTGVYIYYDCTRDDEKESATKKSGKSSEVENPKMKFNSTATAKQSTSPSTESTATPRKKKCSTTAGSKAPTTQPKPSRDAKQSKTSKQRSPRVPSSQN